jgi:hypothetical protein
MSTGPEYSAALQRWQRECAACTRWIAVYVRFLELTCVIFSLGSFAKRGHIHLADKGWRWIFGFFYPRLQYAPVIADCKSRYEAFYKAQVE